MTILNRNLDEMSLDELSAFIEATMPALTYIDVKRCLIEIIHRLAAVQADVATLREVGYGGTSRKKR
jgi:cob(I)alamin adenosyltransferase